MDNMIAPPKVTEDGLTKVVRRALRLPNLQIHEWRSSSLMKEITNPVTRGIYRFEGRGEDRDSILSWSFILKIARLSEEAPDGWGADLHHFGYWKREALVYQSGFLESLPGDLSAPRCYGVEEQSDGSVWLWLEDIHDPVVACWSLSRYGQAARHFGQWQGAYSAGRPLPLYPWLRGGWLRSWVDHFDMVMNYAQRPHAWEHPLVRRTFQVPLADYLLRLWTERHAWIDLLDRLPQTICHFDVWRPNLFACRDEAGQEQTVAIDWQSIGIGPIGEVGNLLVTALMNREVKPEDARTLDSLVWEGYLQGLQEAEWKGDVRAVRFCYTAYPVLRWSWVFPMLMVLPCALDQTHRAEAEEKYAKPVEELLEQGARVCYFLLDLAEEARGLARSLCEDAE